MRGDGHEDVSNTCGVARSLGTRQESGWQGWAWQSGSDISGKESLSFQRVWTTIILGYQLRFQSHTIATFPVHKAASLSSRLSRAAQSVVRGAAFD